MTQHPLEKLMLLAVASGMSLSEFRNAIQAIQLNSPQTLEDLYRNIRNRLRHIDDSLSEIDSEYERANSVSNDVYALIKKANISPQMAAKRITMYVEGTERPSMLPSFNPKDGFSRWLGRVARIIGESALLNAAVAAASTDDRDEARWKLNRE